jgi:hypothetical protein
MAIRISPADQLVGRGQNDDLAWWCARAAEAAERCLA